jgi:hypothetical protein
MTGDGPLLRLSAFDAEDLEVVSAQMQDAILTVGDIKYLPRRKKLALTARRFDWQQAALGTKGPFRRRLAGLTFARVHKATAHNIRQDAEDGVLSLLSVSFAAGDVPSGEIVLTFSGGGLLRLEVECIEASLEDLGPQWETLPRPAHPADPETPTPAPPRKGEGKEG